METLKSLRDKVLRQLDEAGEATASDVVDDAINQAHAERLVSSNWPFLLYPDKQTLTLESGRRTYTLHPDFHRPYYFYNTTQNTFLAEVPMRGLEEAEAANWTNETEGRMFGLWGRSPVAQQPPDAGSQLTIVSTSSSDTGSTYAVTITGTNANGVATESLSPQGTSPATSVHAFKEILSVTLAAPWAGTLTMTDSDADTLLSMLPGELGRSYQQLTLLYEPAEGDEIEYRFYRTPKDLENDYDIPLIPFPYSKILVWDALLIFAAYDNQLSNIRASEWRARVIAIEQSMQAAFLDAQSITARPRLVRYIDAD